MVSIKEEAIAFEQKQTHNIADLPEVPLDLQLEDREGTDSESGKPFQYKVALLNNEEYRVPGVVISNIKSIIETRPNTSKVKVKKEGVGLKTRYTVIALD